MDILPGIFAVKKRCRILGVSLSPKKELVAQYLTLEPDFVFAEDLWLKINFDHKNCSISTVYQALTWFSKNGIAEKIADPGKRNRYRLRLSVI